MFRAVAAQFPTFYHGRGPIDGLAGMAKDVSDHILLSSVPQLNELLEPHIEVRLLTTVLDFHNDLPGEFSSPLISSITPLFAWRLFPMANGVHFQARQFLASSVVDDGNKELPKRHHQSKATKERECNAASGMPIDPAEDWIGNQNFQSALILACGSEWCPRPFQPCITNSVRNVINTILKTNVLIPKERDQLYWQELRDSHPSRVVEFAWPAELPGEPPFDKEAVEILKDTNFSLANLQQIFPNRIKWFWAGVKEEILALSVKEAARQGLSTLRNAYLRDEARRRKQALSAAQESDEEGRVHRYVVRVMV